MQIEYGRCTYLRDIFQISNLGLKDSPYMSLDILK